MTTQLHFSQINIEQEVTRHIQGISSELDEYRQAGELQIEITAMNLFYLEALGFTVDFVTGFVANPESLTTNGTLAQGVTS